MSTAVQSDTRRRAKRRPAGWLLVEAVSDHSGRVLSGRLLDVSDGGLGLVLDEALPEGFLVRVTRGVSTQAGDAPSWEGKQARVAHTTELPDGRWRVGLAFPPEAPSLSQLWGTRLVLLAVLLAIAGPAFFTGSLLTAGGVTAFLLLLLAGAEWQHRAERGAYREAMSRWDTSSAGGLS